MNKAILKAAIYFSVAATFTATAISCNNDDNSTPTTPSSIDPNNFQGKISSGTTETLDPAKVYKLTGKFLVESGATLIIPAGTRVTANEGDTYLIVDRGGKIMINGTAANPVTFEGTAHKQGHWGGIVILGNAPSNRSASGTSSSELGDMIYGGTNKTDNSGSISYLIIKDSGFKYSPEKEFNGLSLFGVGSGTQISNVYVTDGADDGIECFGGNVNLNNIMITGVGDDGFDWTEGYQGNVTNLYVARKKQYQNAGEPGNRGIEADTNDPDNNTTFGNGVSNPSISNATFLGNTAGAESQGLKIRAGSNGKFDNILIANYSTGLDFETDRTYNWFTGENYLKNIRFVNVGTHVKTKDTTPNPIQFTENAGANGAGSGTALPDWAKGWTGLQNFDVSDSMN